MKSLSPDILFQVSYNNLSIFISIVVNYECDDNTMLAGLFKEVVPVYEFINAGMGLLTSATIDASALTKSAALKEIVGHLSLHYKQINMVQQFHSHKLFLLPLIAGRFSLSPQRTDSIND